MVTETNTTGFWANYNTLLSSRSESLWLNRPLIHRFFPTNNQLNDNFEKKPVLQNLNCKKNR